MTWNQIHEVLVFFQHCVSTLGILIILIGVSLAVGKYFYYLFSGIMLAEETRINTIRLELGHTLILGLEFIVAADLIGTTTTPDYYAVGLLAIIVLIRTFLSYSINREIAALSN